MATDKEILIKAIRAKGLDNSLISIYYNIGRALPFIAQRFPDGRVSDWYKSQFVEVRKVHPSGKGGQYGEALGYYYRNGKRDNSSDDPSYCWCKIDDTDPRPIPCSACGSWVLLDILGEPTQDPVKIYNLEDTLEIGKHKGEKVIDVVHNDWKWVKWACFESDHFFFNIDELKSEHRKDIVVLKADDLMPTGKYKGKTIYDIATSDPQYLSWFISNSDDIAIDINSIRDHSSRK